MENDLKCRLFVGVIERSAVVVEKDRHGGYGRMRDGEYDCSGLLNAFEGRPLSFQGFLIGLLSVQDQRQATIGPVA